MDRGKNLEVEMDSKSIDLDGSSSASFNSSSPEMSSAKLVQSVIKSLVFESYRMAQDNVKDRLAGIRHIFRV